jgi:hypothetical protein
MILSVVDRHPFAELIDEYIALKGPDTYWGWSRDRDRNGTGLVGTHRFSKMLPSSLAPFNMLFTAVPEVFTHTDKDELPSFTYATCALFGIEIVEDSVIFSVNNILTEMSFTFVARDYAVFDQSVPLTLADMRIQASRLKAPATEGVDPALAQTLGELKGGHPTLSKHIQDRYSSSEVDWDNSSVIVKGDDTINKRTGRLRWH